ncbi:anaerobic ribonucleoside-triphosphate reductase activating protein [Candidatus Heimdallarchaeota archaeon]|nr:MAG: anaerobic ribonucleoside-triphosphate reductase activating protein [Candidatus Heimdallarchaeota archaeon]
MVELEIKGYQQSSLIEWPGLLVDMIFLGGCNFRCPYCHNPDLLNPGQIESHDINDILAEIDTRKNTKWLDGISITGGEPTVSKKLPKFLGILQDFDLKTKIDTNGSNPQVVQKLLDEKLIDYIAMDVKAIPEKYDKAVGVKAPLDKINETIEIIINSGLDHEFRTTVAPTIVDPVNDIPIIAEMIQGAKRYYIQQFRPLKCLDKSFEKLKPYGLNLLEKAHKAVAPLFEVCEIR